MERDKASRLVKRAIQLVMDDAAKNRYVSQARCVDETNVTIHRTPSGEYSVLDLDHSKEHHKITNKQAVQRIATSLVASNW